MQIYQMQLQRGEAGVRAGARKISIIECNQNFWELQVKIKAPARDFCPQAAAWPTTSIERSSAPSHDARLRWSSAKATQWVGLEYLLPLPNVGLARVAPLAQACLISL
jgi:hypothetical protein